MCGMVLMSFTACGEKTAEKETGTAETKAAEEDNGAASELKEVNIVLDWYPNAVHAFIYDAIEKGYYEEEGIKVNVQFPSNTNDAMSLTAAGRAEVGIYYLPDVIMARANQNVPIRCIGALTQSDLNIILSLKEKNIQGPQDRWERPLAIPVRS